MGTIKRASDVTYMHTFGVILLFLQIIFIFLCVFLSVHPGMPESVLLRAETRAAELEKEKEASGSDRCQQEGETMGGSVKCLDVGMEGTDAVDEEHAAMCKVLSSLFGLDVTEDGCSQGVIEELVSVWSQAKRFL